MKYLYLVACLCPSNITVVKSTRLLSIIFLLSKLPSIIRSHTPYTGCIMCGHSEPAFTRFSTKIRSGLDIIRITTYELWCFQSWFNLLKSSRRRFILACSHLDHHLWYLHWVIISMAVYDPRQPKPIFRAVLGDININDRILKRNLAHFEHWTPLCEKIRKV